MKNLVTLILAGSLILAGCAGKKAMEAKSPTAAAPPPPIEEPAPAMVEEAPVPEPVAPAPVERIEQAAERIFFDFDSYVISADSKAALEGNARWLKDQQQVRIIIEGHADERGSDTYNLALGEKRAQSAREYLLSLGVAEERISIISYGEEKAVQHATNEAQWARDRKAEFVIAD